MRFSIRHQTTYHYGAPAQYSIQQLRQTPPNTPSQFVIRWTIDAPNKLALSYDTYGNVLHTLVLTRPHREIVLLVEGEIETVALQDGRLLEGPGPIPLPHFTCQTRLTMPNAALEALAQGAGPLETPQDLLRLASLIGTRVAYRSGITEVTSTAIEALALGQGVCQDHAHLMLACCRSRGLPARYVSGYLEVGEVQEAASHAWVDVWLEGSGWVSVDVSHACYASERYCRVAVGRDYETAAPVRGMRVGGGSEELEVTVVVDRITNQ
jgi:transglutaminase-like putative cysteine protease